MMEKSQKHRPNRAQRTGRVRAAAGRALIALSLTAAVICLILVYGTRTIQWEDLYAFAGLSHGAEPLAEGEVSVTFLSVGQGDSTLIETPGMTVLIDGGDTYAAQDLCNELDRRGIQRLDYVFLTHPHKDHMGGLLQVMQDYEIGKLYVSTWPDELTPTSDVYFQFCRIIEEKEIDAWRAATNELITLDSGSLTVLAAGGYAELNECSLVIRYAYGKTAFLFMGDAGFQVEDDLMYDEAPIGCEVLKAGHHGSRYSSGSEFLEQTGARWVIASCGADNQYNYPSEDFVKRVDQAGALLMRTDLDGDIRFLSDGARVWYEPVSEEAA